VAEEPVAEEEEEEETGVLAWFKREDLLTMPNWSWVALLLVIILGSCSSCCAMFMIR